MSYIYDILLNFNKELYDFYDWNKNDNIIHIKKIPIFKIDSRKLNEIIKNDVVFDNEIFEKIENKTEEYSDKKIRNLKFVCLLTDGFEVIAISIDNDVLYSRLLVDEETEALEIANRLKETCINYVIAKEKKHIKYKTRKEIEDEKYAMNELENIIKKDDIEELKFIYFDCFNKKCSKKEEIIKELKSKILSGEILEKVIKFFKLKKCIKY